MGSTFSSRILAPGVKFTAINDERFKTNYLSIQLLTRLDRKTAARNAIVPIALTKSCEAFPSLSLLSKQLGGLYGAALSGETFRRGDVQITNVYASSIADRYALEGESVTGRLAALLLECLFHPCLEKVDGEEQFQSATFGMWKKELLDTIDAQISEKRSYALQRAALTVFESEAASIPFYGSREDVEKLTARDAFLAWQEILQTAQIEVISSGAGNLMHQEELFAAAFKNLDRIPQVLPVYSYSPAKESTAHVTENLDMLQSKLVMAFKRNTAIPDITATKVMNAVFGGLPCSKLFTVVREKMSLCYYCSTRYDEYKGVITVDSGVDNSNIQKACEAIAEQLSEVAAGNFTDDNMSAAVFALVSSCRSMNDSPSAMARWYFNQGFIALTGKKIITLEEQISQIEAVTREDIIEAAKGYILDTVYVLTTNNREESE